MYKRIFELNLFKFFANKWKNYLLNYTVFRYIICLHLAELTDCRRFWLYVRKFTLIFEDITQITFSLLSRFFFASFHYADTQINSRENSSVENVGSNFSGNKFRCHIILITSLFQKYLQLIRNNFADLLLHSLLFFIFNYKVVQNVSLPPYIF